MCQLTPEVSKRICSHMNKDHEVSVHAMVISALSKQRHESSTCNNHISISNCVLEYVTLTEMAFSYVECDATKGVCIQKELKIKFNPTLKSSAEVRPRLIKLHQQSLAPRFTWVVTNKNCFQIFSIMVALGYFTINGYETFEKDVINYAPETLQSLIVYLFGSVDSLFTGLKALFYFSIVAHILEAFYVVYLCQTKLKLNVVTSLSWFLIVSIVGYPMTMKVLGFVSIYNQSQKKDKKK